SVSLPTRRSSDLAVPRPPPDGQQGREPEDERGHRGDREPAVLSCQALSPRLLLTAEGAGEGFGEGEFEVVPGLHRIHQPRHAGGAVAIMKPADEGRALGVGELYLRSEEHTSELQSRENLVCR